MSTLTAKHFTQLSKIYESTGVMGMNGYDTRSAAIKNDFHLVGKRALRSLAKDMGLEKGEYEVRSNKAGPAVGGEITLHTKTKYIQISGSAVMSQPVLFRTCEGLKDYTGGPNNFCHIMQIQGAINSI